MRGFYKRDLLPPALASASNPSLTHSQKPFAPTFKASGAEALPCKALAKTPCRMAARRCHACAQKKANCASANLSAPPRSSTYSFRASASLGVPGGSGRHVRRRALRHCNTLSPRRGSSSTRCARRPWLRSARPTGRQCTRRGRRCERAPRN